MHRFNSSGLPSLARVFLCLFLLWICACSHAAEKQLKIGSLVPKNSLYQRELTNIGEVWKKAQSGSPKLLIYPDGSQGGEQAQIEALMRASVANDNVMSLVELATGLCLPLVVQSFEMKNDLEERLKPKSQPNI